MISARRGRRTVGRRSVAVGSFSSVGDSFSSNSPIMDGTDSPASVLARQSSSYSGRTLQSISVDNSGNTIFILDYHSERGLRQIAMWRAANIVEGTEYFSFIQILRSTKVAIDPFVMKMKLEKVWKKKKITPEQLKAFLTTFSLDKALIEILRKLEVIKLFSDEKCIEHFNLLKSALSAPNLAVVRATLDALIMLCEEAGISVTKEQKQVFKWFCALARYADISIMTPIQELPLVEGDSEADIIRRNQRLLLDRVYDFSHSYDHNAEKIGHEGMEALEEYLGKCDLAQLLNLQIAVDQLIKDHSQALYDCFDDDQDKLDLLEIMQQQYEGFLREEDDIPAYFDSTCLLLCTILTAMQESIKPAIERARAEERSRGASLQSGFSAEETHALIERVERVSGKASEKDKEKRSSLPLSSSLPKEELLDFIIRIIRSQRLPQRSVNDSQVEQALILREDEQDFNPAHHQADVDELEVEELGEVEDGFVVQPAQQTLQLQQLDIPASNKVNGRILQPGETLSDDGRSPGSDASGMHAIGGAPTPASQHSDAPLLGDAERANTPVPVAHSEKNVMNKYRWARKGAVASLVTGTAVSLFAPVSKTSLLTRLGLPFGAGTVIETLCYGLPRTARENFNWLDLLKMLAAKVGTAGIFIGGQYIEKWQGQDEDSHLNADKEPVTVDGMILLALCLNMLITIMAYARAPKSATTVEHQHKSDEENQLSGQTHQIATQETPLLEGASLR